MTELIYMAREGAALVAYTFTLNSGCHMVQTPVVKITFHRAHFQSDEVYCFSNYLGKINLKKTFLSVPYSCYLRFYKYHMENMAFAYHIPQPIKRWYLNIK